MIRPVTCLAFLLACGSGLYLYQSKHRVQVLDRQIGQTIKATDALREQTRMLHAEWTLLNDPERLRQLSDQFLTLKTVAPGQFTSLAELDNRLPQPIPPAPPAASTPGPALQPEAAPVVVAAAQDDVQTAQSAPDVTLPLPPMEPPAPPPVRIASAVPIAEPTRPVERRPPAPHPPIAQPSPPRIAAMEQRPAEPRGGLPRPAVAASRAPIATLPVAATGSMLGMAHGSPGVPPPQPLPRPMPVNASYFDGTGG